MHPNTNFTSDTFKGNQKKFGVIKNVTTFRKKEYVHHHIDSITNTNLTDSISKTESQYYDIKNRLDYDEIIHDSDDSTISEPNSGSDIPLRPNSMFGKYNG